MTDSSPQRAYALDQARSIDSAEDRQGTLDQILRWYITAASNACLLLVPGDRFIVEVPPADGPEPVAFENAAAAYEWYDIERPNIVANARAALDSGLPRRAWELAMVVSPIHAQHFVFEDWSILSSVAVTAAEELAEPAALAAALDNRGRFLFRRRALGEAKEAHSRALAIRKKTGDQVGVCRSLNALGLVCLHSRELAEAADYFTATAEQAGHIADPHWEGLARMNLVEAQLEAGDAFLALEAVTPLPQFFADLQDPAYEGNALWLLSWARRLCGDAAAALTAIDAALRIADGASNRMWEAFWLIEAARVHLAMDDTDEAMRCCRMAASLERQIGDPGREATALDCVGEVLQAIGNAGEAAAFHREAARMQQQLGNNWQAGLATVHLADCQQALGDTSREQLAAALVLLHDFTDSRAEQLKAAVRARL